MRKVGFRESGPFIYHADTAVVDRERHGPAAPGSSVPDLLHEMFRPWALVDPAAPKSGAYGYGWFIDNRGAEYDHDTDINRFVSYNTIFPAKRAEVIVLSNLESSDVRSLAEHLAGLMGIDAA